MSVVQGVELCAEEVEALQCAHTGGAYCYDMSEIGNDCFDGFAWYGDNLGVHGMLVGICHLDGLEGAGSYVQGDFGGLYALLA